MRQMFYIFWLGADCALPFTRLDSGKKICQVYRFLNAARHTLSFGEVRTGILIREPIGLRHKNELFAG